MCFILIKKISLFLFGERDHSLYECVAGPKVKKWYVYTPYMRVRGPKVKRWFVYTPYMRVMGAKG